MRCFLLKALLVGLFLPVAIFQLVEQEAESAADPLTPEERAFVAAHGPIRYAPDPQFPPFEFLDSSGVARGITPDLLIIMGRKLGVEFRTVAYPTWSDVLEAVKRGKVDLLGTLTRTPEREGFLLFSSPYLSVPYVLFVRQNGSDPKTVEDMVSRRLGVVRNYGINAWLSAEHPKIRPVAVEDTATGLAMVATGQLDALLETLPVGAHIAREKSLTNIRIVPLRVYTLPQHFGVRKGEPLLLSIVQKGLDSLTETERSEVFVRWTGQDYSRPPPAISPLLRNALFVLVAAAVLSWVWIVALRRNVRRATQSLRESEERFRVLSEQSPLGMTLIDRQGRYEYVNPAFESIFGYTLDEVPTEEDWFRVAFPDPEIRKEVIRAWKEDLESSSVREARPRTFDVTCKDGARKSILFRPVSLSRDRQLVIYEDITRQRELQAQLQQAIKMEAVGNLAGGVAHDFNNVLTVIVGFGEMLKLRIANDPKAVSDTDEILRGAERASVLTRQLLTFARRQVVEPVNLDLNELMTDLVKLIRKVTREDIEIKTFPAGCPVMIRADRGQVEQVLMNLCLNARDAMPEGGRLFIETGVTLLEEGYLKQYPYMKAGRHAVLSVSDTGTGMDEKTRERVFEPFFTTKGPDKGTGLGLAVVYGIVKQHNGFIHVYSEPGKGTMFRVYFPEVDAPADAKVIASQGVVHGGSETILLAEDNESVRHLAEQTLISYGYRVLIACDGEEALDSFRRHGKEIAMVVLDVVMPKKGGKQAYDEMIRTIPELKVLFLSGYSANAIHESFVLLPGLSFLQKPFGPDVLARKVREVLDRRQGRMHGG